MKEKAIIANSTLNAIAQSIIDKGGASAPMLPREMPDAIMAIPSGGEVESKADKVVGAVSGNLAGLNSEGNLTDSGHSPSSFASASALSSKSEVTLGDIATVLGWTDNTSTPVVP